MGLSSADVKAVILAAQDQTDSKTFLDDSSIPGLRLGVRIVIGSRVGCIHAIRKHLLSLVN